MKRAKRSKECANPLFEKWLTEWRDEASSKNLKTKYVYDKALRSLRKYPLRLASGREAIVLDFFGQKICDMLDKKLASHAVDVGNTSDDDDDNCGSHRKGAPSATKLALHPSPSSIKRSDVAKTSGKAYVPVPGTGPHALLMTLYNAGGLVGKSALMAAAQPMCDTSFLVPEPGSYYTAWSSMGTLIKKGLVQKEGNPAKYMITDAGQDLARQLLVTQRTIGDKEDKNSHDAPVPRPSQPRPPSLPRLDSQDPHDETPFSEFRLLPGTFDVLLCIDNCETVTGGHQDRKLMIQSELRKNGTNFDVRKLHVGDFLWVARERVSIVPGHLHLPKARELVLDLIVERKRMDDLAASIIDGRFHEQKYRMRQCGLKHPIYLIEEYGSKVHLPLPESSLQQAISNTQVKDGFIVKHTRDSAESVAYLTLMTRYLQTVYSGKTLRSRSTDDESDRDDGLLAFEDFNRSSMKIRPNAVTELFVKQLIQLSGISVERARAISNTYSTPATLMAQFAHCDSQSQRDTLLAFVQYGAGKRNLGSAASKLLSQLYTSHKLT